MEDVDRNGIFEMTPSRVPGLPPSEQSASNEHAPRPARPGPSGWRSLRRFFGSVLLSLCALVALWSSDARAENLIKKPGAHNEYSFELEPHLYTRYGGYWGAAYGRSLGIGPGLRASIPFMHNGPISSINNNIGISFGLDVPFFFGDGNGVAFDIPVAFQWNFYFTKVISVAGEAGLLSSIWSGSGVTRFYAFPIVQGAGRFQWGKVGLLVRVGYPSTTVGANIQF